MDITIRAWRDPFSVSSDFARRNAAHVAMAACRGLITTRITSNVYGRVWHVTAGGMRYIGELEA